MKFSSLKQLAAVAIGLGATTVVLTTTAQSQVGAPKNVVILQPTTPGTSQSGHANISGTMRATTFRGSSAALASGANNSLLQVNSGGSSGSTFFGGAIDVRAATGNGVSAEALGGTCAIVGAPVTANSLGVGICGDADVAGTFGLYGRGIAGSTALLTQGSSVFQGNLGIGQADTLFQPTFPIDFAETLGDKISLWGTSPASHYGFGVQSGTLQMFCGTISDRIAFGFGGSGAFTQNMQIQGSGVVNIGNTLSSVGSGRLILGSATNGNFDGMYAVTGATGKPFYGYSLGGSLSGYSYIDGADAGAFKLQVGGAQAMRIDTLGNIRLRPGGSNIQNIESDYDIDFRKDFDNSNTDAWFRIFTDVAREQLRIIDGVDAAAFFDGAVNANGIDYAEAFKALDPNLEAGDVVTIQETGNWQYVNKSGRPYDATVIGVVSKKPGFVTGMSFEQENAIDPELAKRRDDAAKKGDHTLEKALTKQLMEKVSKAYRPIAFMGRVPVKVTGVVHVGDHLTSSDVPGKAMAMTGAGHSLGIALEDSNGSGMVMTLIMPKFFGGATTSPNSIQGIIRENAALKEKMATMESKFEALQQRLERLESSSRK